MSSQDQMNDQIQRASQVQAKYANDLMSKPNVVGVGVGHTKVGGIPSPNVGVIVMVDHKVPEAELSLSDVIPKELDGVPIDVQETGTFGAG